MIGQIEISPVLCPEIGPPVSDCSDGCFHRTRYFLLVNGKTVDLPVLLRLQDCMIRQFGSYPEGVTYGILLMNIATPLIDRLPRKIYGIKKEAKKA